MLRFRTSADVASFLKELDLAFLEEHLVETLGVDSFADLAYVREEDLELKPIQLRKFLHHRPARSPRYAVRRCADPHIFVLRC